MDGDYSTESDFTTISLTDTIVDADGDEFEMVNNAQQTNYYSPIQDDNTQIMSQIMSNESDNEIDENNNLHEETSISNEEPKPDEIQSNNNNNILIPPIETVNADAHLSNNTGKAIPEATKNAIPDDTNASQPALGKSNSIQYCPHQLTTCVNPVTETRESHYTGGYSYAMTALEHIDEI